MALSKSLALYYLSHSGPYSFQHTKYSTLRPFLLFTSRLLRSFSSSKDFKVSILPSTKTGDSSKRIGLENGSRAGGGAGSS